MAAQQQADILIAELQKGSHQAFTLVYRSLHERLYFYALRFVAESDAEDITADSFVEFWKRRQTLHSMNDISAFLHVTVRNRCFNLLRHQRVRDQRQEELLQVLSQPSPDDDHLLEQVRVELINMIYSQIDRLPPRMREVFLLSYREGLKPGQIARQLGITMQTVSNQKVTAIKLLKKALHDHHLLGALIALLQFDNFG